MNNINNFDNKDNTFEEVELDLKSENPFQKFDKNLLKKFFGESEDVQTLIKVYLTDKEKNNTDIEENVNRFKINAIVGNNGSGKTAFLNYIFDKKNETDSDEEENYYCVIFDNYSVFSQYSYKTLYIDLINNFSNKALYDRSNYKNSKGVFGFNELFARIFWFQESHSEIINKAFSWLGKEIDFKIGNDNKDIIPYIVECFGLKNDDEKFKNDKRNHKKHLLTYSNVKNVLGMTQGYDKKFKEFFKIFLSYFCKYNSIDDIKCDGEKYILKTLLLSMKLLYGKDLKTFYSENEKFPKFLNKIKELNEELKKELNNIIKKELNEELKKELNEELKKLTLEIEKSELLNNVLTSLKKIIKDCKDSDFKGFDLFIWYCKYFISPFEITFGEKYFSQLSSGEQFVFLRNIYTFTEIIKQNKNKVIVLVDEPDLHLHLEWQRKYIQTLIDIFSSLPTKIELNFIIATHSPFILSDLPKESIILMEKKEESSIVKISKIKNKTFGSNFIDLINNGFFFKDKLLMGSFAEKILRHISDLEKKRIVDNINEKEDQINKIKDMMGDEFLKNTLLYF